MSSEQPGRWTLCAAVVLAVVAAWGLAGCGAPPDAQADNPVDAADDQPRGLLLSTPAAHPGYVFFSSHFRHDLPRRDR